MNKKLRNRIIRKVDRQLHEGDVNTLVSMYFFLDYPRDFLK